MSRPTSPTLTPTPGGSPGGCLVLVPADAQTPEALVRALGSRELQTRVLHDEPAVMEALAEMGGDRRVLVVVEPARWARLAELLAAVQAYHHGVLCWQYTQRNGGPGRLTALDHGARADEATPQTQAEYEDDTSPIGQITSHRRRPIDKLLVKVPGRPLTSREVVTQQELTMLLGPVPGEAS